MSSRASLKEFKSFCQGYFCDRHLQIVNPSNCAVSFWEKLCQYLEPPTQEDLSELFKKLYKLKTLFYSKLTPEERKGCNEKLNRLFALTGKPSRENPLKREAEEDEKISNILPLHHFIGSYITYEEVLPEKLPDLLQGEASFQIPILKEIHGEVARIPERDLQKLYQSGCTHLDVIKYLLVNLHADHEKDHPYYVPGLGAAREISNLVDSTIRWKQTGKPA